MLQFVYNHQCYFDWLHVAKSTIPNAGFGLFASRDMPCGAIFSLYLGRKVLTNDMKRTYTMQMPLTFVTKKKNLKVGKKLEKGEN